MKIGMLWCDDDKTRTLEEKVQRAVEFYAAKYGAMPNCCYVNPTMLEGAELPQNGVEVYALGTVFREHFWVGVKGGS